MLEILMIEDDVELAEVLSDYLKQHGINVTNYDEPYTGMSALATKNFDLLLLDLTLSLIHISEPTRHLLQSRMPSSA